MIANPEALDGQECMQAYSRSAHANQGKRDITSLPIKTFFLKGILAVVQG